MTFFWKKSADFLSWRLNFVFFKQLEVARGYCAAAASREVTQNLPCHLFLHRAAEGVGPLTRSKKKSKKLSRIKSKKSKRNHEITKKSFAATRAYHRGWHLLLLHAPALIFRLQPLPSFIVYSSNLTDQAHLRKFAKIMLRPSKFCILRPDRPASATARTTTCG